MSYETDLQAGLGDWPTEEARWQLALLRFRAAEAALQETPEHRAYVVAREEYKALHAAWLAKGAPRRRW